MNFREILQIEIWSKRTTRKVVSGLWRVLKPVMVGLGSAAVLLFVFYEVEARWLTSDERQAARAALAKAETLEPQRFCRCERFAAADAETKEAIEVAREKARTLRDNRVLGLLDLYRWQMVEESEDDLRYMQVEEFRVRRHIESPADQDFEEKRKNSMSNVFSSLREVLHKELD
jgi:hypothetical protein